MIQELSAYGLKRIADMDRGELIDVINSLYRSYLAVNRRSLGPDKTQLPMTEVDQYRAVLESWFTEGAAHEHDTP